MNTEPLKNGSVSNGENSNKIILGGQEYPIERLKAGKFYAALKVYMDIIRDITQDKQVSADQKEQTVNLDKLIVSMFQSWPEKMIKFISICSNQEELTEEKIKDIAYPEEITTAFKTCTKLNRVAENLKNFVAPIGELGAEVQAKK